VHVASARRLAWPALLAVSVVAVDLHVRGQGAAPSFEVASVRPALSAPFGFPGLMVQPGGRAISPGSSVRQLILTAYGLEDLQLIGGPAWIASDLYAIEARTVEGVTRANVRLMLRALLHERFQLAAHAETRDLPAYALTLANRDGRLGKGLRRSGPECAPVTAPQGVPLPPPPPPGPGPQFMAVLPNDPLGPTCGYVSFPGWISGRRITMGHFVQALTGLLRRPIVNETALAGEFDLDVTFTPDQGTVGGLPASSASVPAPPPGALAPPTDRPSLLTAMQEDLGLKLDARRRVVDVLVIDRVERPSEN
jgi:uncharacterized protein (TIGR03435 family)